MQIYFNTTIAIIYLVLGLLKSNQEFKYRNPDKMLIKKYLHYQISAIPSDAAYALKYLPKHYSTIGNVDYTEYLQKALNDNEIIVIPNFPILVGKSGLLVGSNKTIIFQKNSEFIFAGPANGKFWDILKIYGAKNVNIINPNIKGSRDNAELQSGEWSAGISILNSKNVMINNPKIYNTYGDGIFIGSENGGFSENIKVTGGWIDNARRNGISITSGKNVFLNNILISNTNGTLPEAGIDIEPSLQEYPIHDINLNNIYTYNNKMVGISINMNALSVGTPSKKKVISININNHKDRFSSYAFGTSLNDSKNLYDAVGVVNVNNSSWDNNKGLYWKTNTKQSIIINFKNIKTSNAVKYKNLQTFLKKQSNFTLK